ncbi:aldo/keto reductase [Rummeliibacillus sp. NPDC094406]|uniref:aldo/keto reductase n=1 Tax=Rummeliibacillus sp. NPDC094406 TaxID=3364511 RepID=UPI003819D8E1
MKNIMLNNSYKVPQMGLGVFLVEDEKVLTDAVNWAYEAGYRHFDTAQIYNNEAILGKALAPKERSSYFLTTKVWNSNTTYEETLNSFEESLQKLQTDFVDLLLIHWPSEGYVEKWRALETLYQQGKAKAIGVSNFEIHQLQALMETATIKPMINQIETHPYFQQNELREFMEKEGIFHQSWAPLGQGLKDLFEEPVLQALANKYQKSVPQIILRWHLDRNSIVIPKSVHKERLEENINVFDFTLTEKELEEIASLDRGLRVGPNPADEAWLKETTGK